MKELVLKDNPRSINFSASQPSIDMTIRKGDVATLYHHTGVLLAVISSADSDVYQGEITHCGYDPELKSVLQPGKPISFPRKAIFAISKGELPKGA